MRTTQLQHCITHYEVFGNHQSQRAELHSWSSDLSKHPHTAWLWKGLQWSPSLLKWISLFRTDPKNHVTFQDSKHQHPYSEGMKATEPLRIPPNIPRGVTTWRERAQLRAPGSISSLSPIQNARPCHCKRARKKLISKEKGNGAGWLQLTSNAETLLSWLHRVMA